MQANYSPAQGFSTRATWHPSSSAKSTAAARDDADVRTLLIQPAAQEQQPGFQVVFPLGQVERLVEAQLTVGKLNAAFGVAPAQQFPENPGGQAPDQVPAAVLDSTPVHALLRPTAKWQIPHAAPGASRFITSGTPDLSAILVRMRSRRPSSQMPPLGTVLHDREAIELVTGWIEDLAR